MPYAVPLNPNRMMSTFHMQPGWLKMVENDKFDQAQEGKVLMSQFVKGGFLIHRFNVPSIILVGNFQFIVGGASILTMGNLQGVRFCGWGLMSLQHCWWATCSAWLEFNIASSIPSG